MIRATAVLFLLLATACSSMRYDLDGLSFPVRADAGRAGQGEPFRLKSKYVMYVHGLLGEKQPSGRMSRPSEIGAAVLWLASPVAHNVTGISLPIDGGWTSQ